MKKLISLALCAVLAVGCTLPTMAAATFPPQSVGYLLYVPLKLFEALLTDPNGFISETDDLGAVQIPNPFTDCDTLDEAEKLVGFELSAPDVIGQSTGRLFRASDFDLLEVIYKQGDTETARVRKAAGSDDISGDYNNYAYVGDISTNGMTVTVKGEKDNISLAIWQKDGYTYSVSVESPLSAAEMSTLVSSIR